MQQLHGSHGGKGLQPQRSRAPPMISCNSYGYVSPLVFQISCIFRFFFPSWGCGWVLECEHPACHGFSRVVCALVSGCTASLSLCLSLSLSLNVHTHTHIRAATKHTNGQAAYARHTYSSSAQTTHRCCWRRTLSECT